MTEAPTRILCIEDNAMNWRLVQRLLSQAGHELHWATDGLAGVRMALEVKPDLILLDINLPDLSGFEVATKLRHLPDMAHTLIVALTAKTLPVDRDTALVTGCDGFIAKPIDPFEFVGQVEGYLQGRRDRLAQGQEQAALRQFTHQVVDHLEARLLEVQQANAKLLEAQIQLERRSGLRARILSLMQGLVFLRDARDIAGQVLHRLGKDLDLDGAVCFFQHASGAYFEGLRWRKGALALEEMEPLLRSHPLLPCVEGCPHAHPMTGEGLAAGDCWHPGLRLGLWTTSTHAACQPMHERGHANAIWGLLTIHRADGPLDAFELEVMSLHAQMLQVAVENAQQISSLEEHSRALGASYASLDEVRQALRTAQAALADAGLALRASSRRWVAAQDAKPVNIRLHAFLLEELALAKTQATWPHGLALSLDLAADRDLVWAHPADLQEACEEALGRLAQQGLPGLRLSTRVEAGAVLLALTGFDRGEGGEHAPGLLLRLPLA